LRSGEVLTIGADGRVKKVNTFTAILVCQMQLKKQIKRRRALKAMEEEAAKKAEMLKKQAARLQEKKWRNAMKEDADEEEGDEMPGRPRLSASRRGPRPAPQARPSGIFSSGGFCESGDRSGALGFPFFARRAFPWASRPR